jgi:hypothetical protein
VSFVSAGVESQFRAMGVVDSARSIGPKDRTETLGTRPEGAQRDQSRPRRPESNPVLLPHTTLIFVVRAQQAGEEPWERGRSLQLALCAAAEHRGWGVRSRPAQPRHRESARASRPTQINTTSNHLRLILILRAG